MKNLRRNESGFTLIELIVVMIIIGILVLLATPRFIRYIKDANATALTVDVKVIKDAALYKNLRAYDEAGMETGYPVTSDPLKSLDDIVANDLVENTDLDNWKEAVKETYKEATGKELQDDADVFALIEGEQLHSHIRNTRNNMDNFSIIVKGDGEGEVFYTGIVEDGDGLAHVGLTNSGIEVIK